MVRADSRSDRHKLLISVTLVSLVQLDLAPAWMVGVIIGRELTIPAFAASPTRAVWPCRRRGSAS